MDNVDLDNRDTSPGIDVSTSDLPKTPPTLPPVVSLRAESAKSQAPLEDLCRNRFA